MSKLQLQLIFIFIIFHTIGNAQTPDSIYVWQGFKHKWTYNHRVNRIGNFIDENKKEIVYTSASGLGADSTYYTSKYSLITNSELNAYSGKTSFEIKGSEGQYFTLSKEIKIPVSEEDYGRKIMPLLNGFDLISLDKADKIKIFGLDIYEKKMAVTSSGYITIAIDLKFEVNCSTIECERRNEGVNYNLDVYYVVLTAKKNNTILNGSANIASFYHWNKKKEVIRDSMYKPVVYEDKENIPIVGIKKFYIKTEGENWLKEWNNYIGEPTVNPDNSFTSKLDLFYKEWSKKMKWKSAYRRHSIFSKRGKGEVELRMDLILLHGKTGTVESIISEGKMFWKGKNKPASSEDAVDRRKF